MKLLAIDTSGAACSAALLLGEQVEQRLECTARRHGELILSMMQDLLDARTIRLRDLDAIVFGRGPGSFTGVRIAVAVAQGAAFGAGLPLVPVSTLAGIALGEFRRSRQTRLLVALDARMEEVYWGCFEVAADGDAHPRCAEQVCRPEAVEVPEGGGWMGVGPGWAAYPESLSARTGTHAREAAASAICEARDLLALGRIAFARGESISPELATPVYLRDRVTQSA